MALPEIRRTSGRTRVSIDRRAATPMDLSRNGARGTVRCSRTRNPSRFLYQRLFSPERPGLIKSQQACPLDEGGEHQKVAAPRESRLQPPRRRESMRRAEKR